MRIDPDLQGRGLGTEFARFQIEECCSLGARVVRLLTSWGGLGCLAYSLPGNLEWVLRRAVTLGCNGKKNWSEWFLLYEIRL
ncbi:MAG: hypothetical protein AB1446_08750 [Bacillota bacterium]